MGLMTIASQVRWSGKKGMPTLTEIEIPTIVHSKAEMNIGLLKPVKTFSRDGHGTLEKQSNFQQRCLWDFRKTI